MGFVGRHMKNFTAKREEINGLFSPNSWWWPALALPIFGGIAIYFMIDGRTWNVWMYLYLLLFGPFILCGLIIEFGGKSKKVDGKAEAAKNSGWNDKQLTPAII